MNETNKNNNKNENEKEIGTNPNDNTNMSGKIPKSKNNSIKNMDEKLYNNKRFILRGFLFVLCAYF